MKVFAVVLIIAIPTLFLSGCSLGSRLTQYQSAVEQAQKASVEVAFETAAKTQEAYKMQYGTYADSTEKLKGYGIDTEGLTVERADANSYHLKLEKYGQTFYYQKK